MNKKAASGTVIVLAILLIFFFVVGGIFFFQDGLLPQIAKATKGFEKFLPGRPQQDISPGKTTTPEETSKLFDDLYNAFNDHKAAKKCLNNYTSLDMGGNIIELEYITAENGLNMRLLNKKNQLLSSHLVSGIKPCIVLPAPDESIADTLEISYKIIIKRFNKIEYSNGIKTFPYSLFDKYPLLYKPDKDHACFFTDSIVINHNTGREHGNTKLNNGFDNGDMKEKETLMTRCS